MSLYNELETARKEIKTDTYPITIRELVSLYRDGEIDIHPEFQRFMRWTEAQKTKLIESILLGIPLPSVFLFQRKDGVLDVVDGLQRISTILRFMGELKGEDGDVLSPLVMGKADYLPSLEGKLWGKEGDSSSVGAEIQRFFRQEKLQIQMLLRDSDEQTKFELFQRINTGGTPLSDQEVRNCILIMINRDAYFWLEGISQDLNFQECCAVPDRMKRERYDTELALRFLTFEGLDVSRVSEISDLNTFITKEMRENFNENYDFDTKKISFSETFKLLNECSDENVLRKYDCQKGRFMGPFLISAFEMIALGVSANLEHVKSKEPEWLLEKIKSLWNDQRTFGIYGTGVSTARRLPKTIDFGREFFSEE